MCYNGLCLMCNILNIFVKHHKFVYKIYRERERKMKRRIISTVLVVVMLALTLVGCGYDFTKKDMSENAAFKDGMSAEAFKAALLTLSVEDADFGNAGEAAKRADKIKDHIYNLLVKKVDEKTAEQLKEGNLDNNDLLYYSYYAVYEKVTKVEGQDDKKENVIVYPSKMSGTPVSIKLGHSNETLTGKDKAIRDAIIAALTDGTVDFKDYAYKTTSDTTKVLYDYVNEDADKKVTVYVTYTVTEKITENNEVKDQTKNYKNVKMVLDLNDGAANSFLVNALLERKEKSDTDSTLVGKYNLNTKIDKIIDDKGTLAPDAPAEGADQNVVDEYNTQKAEAEKDDVKYTDITVNFAIESGEAVSAEYTVEKEISGVDVEEGSNIKIPEGAKVTYYVYPVYYFEVEDLDAESILNTLTESLTKDSYDCLNNAETEVTAFNDALKAYNEAKKKFEEADKALNDETTGAQAKYDKAVKDAIKAEQDKFTEQADKDAINAETEAVKNNDLVKAAKTVLDNAKTAYDTANEALNGKAAEGETPAVKGAEEKYNDALAALLAKVGDDNNAETTDDAEKGAAKLVEEYNKSVKDELTEKYETEMKTHIGQAIWKLMKDSVKVNNLPEKSVKEAYERMYEIHEHKFYTGSHSASGLTNYKYYSDKGGFKQYLIDTVIGTGKGDFDDAKDKVWAEAEEYVEKIVIIYYIAEVMDLELDKDEIKEAKGTGAAAKDMEKQYGKTNILAAAQADKLFDYFLEVEKTTNADGEEEDKKDENGSKIYKNVKVTTYTEKAD